MGSYVVEWHFYIIGISKIIIQKLSYATKKILY